MITVKNVTDATAVIAAFEPDITIALAAYNTFKSIWLTMFPGKTEADFLTYLQTASQTNVNMTSAYLIAQGFVETPAGSGTWSKPVA